MRHLYSLAIAIFFVGCVHAQTGTGWNWAAISGQAVNAPGRKTLDVASDAAGNVYATGRFMGSMTIGGYTISTSGDGTVNANYDEDAWTAKWDANGNIQWLKRYGASVVSSSEIGQVVTTDASANVYVGVGNGFPVVIKYDAAGNQLWAKTLTLFEVGSVNIGPDGNPVVITSNQTAKDIFKLDNATGNIIWTVHNTGIGSNAGTTYKDIIDQSGNVYYTAFYNGSATITIAGQSYTQTRLTTYIVSLTNAGVLRWVQPIDNIQVQLGYTIDPDGRSFIVFSGGSGGTFQGVNTTSPTGNRYLELDNAGALVRYLNTCPYKAPFLAKSDGIYGYYLEVGGIARTVTLGNNYFYVPANSTVGLGIIVKYDRSDDHVIWANNFEIDGASYNPGGFSCIAIGPGSKLAVGGHFGTQAKFGPNTYTTSIGGGYNQTDLFVAQFDGANVQPSPTTIWTGAADNSWNNSANWSNGIPTGAETTVIPAGLPRYPTGITNANRTAKLIVDNGVSISLPYDFNAAAGIVNNGVIEVTGASGNIFQGFNTSAPSLLTGTGRILFTANSPGTIFYNFTTNGLEINKPGGTITSYGGNIGGGLYLTGGLLQAVLTVTMTNPNATLSSTATSYVVGSLQRAVNANGVYAFPVGTASNPEPVSLSLNGISGPQYITASFSTSSPGTVNTTASGVPVTAALNGGYWTITPDVALASGSYTVTLNEKGASNTVGDPTRYVVIKRPGSSGAWGFFGTNGTAAQNGGVTTAVAGNINGFSDFAIGIATGTVGTALPLHLLSFIAARSGMDARLDWVTTQEQNTAYFDIEHSTDGISWHTAGQVNALHGSGRNEYHFVHASLPGGRHYYRLKQVDADGHYTYSSIASVELSNRESIRAYPNPVTGGVITVTYNGAAAAFTLTNAEGQQVRKGWLQKGDNRVAVDGLAPGTYWVRLSNGVVLSFVK